MTQQFCNAFEFRPEAVQPVFVDGIRTLPIWRADIKEGIDSISLARLKKGSYQGGGTVFIPDDDEHLRKIAWGSRDLGPTIVNGRVVASGIVSASVSGKRHIFLKAPYGKGTEMLWRINTGLWGDGDEVFRVQALMRGGKMDTPANPLFHGCYAVEGGEGEEVLFAEHATAKSAHGYLVAKDLKIGRWNDVVLGNGEKTRVSERRTWLWRNFDGFKLAVVGCIPDSGHILINDKGKGRIERPTDQRKFRSRVEDYFWASREAAKAKAAAGGETTSPSSGATSA